MNTHLPLRSALLDDLEATRVYYANRMVGEHKLVLPSGVTITVRFGAEETHVFSEEIRQGTTPDPKRLVHGPGLGEVRVFSKTRARLLDEILPTIQRPAVCFEAKMYRGLILIGPQKPRTWDRVAVVVQQKNPSTFFVRTAYPQSPEDYRRACRSRGVPWPPK